MKFREIIDSPCGIRYLFDALELQSGYARIVLLDREMMTSPEEIAASYASLRHYIALVREDRRKVEDLQFHLQGLRDIRSTLASLSEGIVLDEIELFEIKHLALLADKLGSGRDMTQVIEILDPDGLRIGTFYLYDSYSPQLRRLRSLVEQDPDDPDLREDLLNEEDRIKQLLSSKLQPLAEDLRETLSALAELDIVLAKALQFVKEGLVIPEIGSSSLIKGMFHPEIKSVLKNHGRDFEPVDFDFRLGVTSTVIGANMGGKTVVLKTLCMMQLLFQFGFAVPAESVVMMPFDDIRFCIGDEQDEKRGLSSFAAEMRRIDRLIEAVDSGVRVLGLVDEPARTTNPVEGSALVEALLKRLSDKDNLALVMTTHYTVANSGQCWKVKGLLPGTGGRKMDYRLEKTSDNEVPHEALNIARELSIDSRWIEIADTIMKRQYE